MTRKQGNGPDTPVILVSMVPPWFPYLIAIAGGKLLKLEYRHQEKYSSPAIAANVKNK